MKERQIPHKVSNKAWVFLSPKEIIIHPVMVGIVFLPLPITLRMNTSNYWQEIWFHKSREAEIREKKESDKRIELEHFIRNKGDNVFRCYHECGCDHLSCKPPSVQSMLGVNGRSWTIEAEIYKAGTISEW